MFKRIKPVFERVSNARHPEYQSRNTTVSEYLRKYGQGKIDSLPTDSRPEVTDDRSPDDMLADDSRMDHMSYDELDAIMDFNAKRADFEKARQDIELNEKQTKAFNDAMEILNDSNASHERKMEAMEVIDELIKSGKVVRARKL